MHAPLADDALAQLFLDARTHSAWLDRPVPDELLVRLYGLLRMGPTAANSCPGRFVFVRTPAGKERLRPALAPGNVAKTMAAPVTVIVGQDLAFYDQLPRLFPHVDARSWFAGDERLAAETAFRSSSLQGAYLIVAARALGLDCGPMSGFDSGRVEAEFFAGTAVRCNFLVNLGYGDRERLHPRHPRLDFDDACRLL